LIEQRIDEPKRREIVVQSIIIEDGDHSCPNGTRGGGTSNLSNSGDEK
jgi:hypothetical protein